MKSLFNPSDNQELVDRIGRLNPNSTALWGKISVNQMLAHCRRPIATAFGEKPSKRSFFGFLFGKIALKGMMQFEKPIQKNLPTDRKFVVINPGAFDIEKQLLMAEVNSFLSKGPQSITKEPHPFFGKMSVQEWDVLQWRHLDHHLKQFGA